MSLHANRVEKDVFTNVRECWQPVGSRGLFGGAVIAQCVLAAQETVPDTFTVHSMHCYFVMAGQRTAPVFYHVERVRDGRSIATRTVQARQWGKVIFTTTLSFVIEAIGEEKTLEHSVSIPTALPDPDGEDSADMNTRKLGRVGFMKRTIKTENCKDSLFRCLLYSLKLESLHL